MCLEKHERKITVRVAKIAVSLTTPGEVPQSTKIEIVIICLSKEESFTAKNA